MKDSSKLSSTGYGYVKDAGGTTVLDSEGKAVPVAIPSEQRLKDHAATEKHRLNVERSELSKASLANKPTEVVYKSITFEDELYARTVRTVHLIASRQLSMNDMYSLLELQNANGAIISFDHAGCQGGVEAGGVAAWLKAGSEVFMGQMRARAMNKLVVKLFPNGTPFGGMGDGSNDRSLIEQEAVVLRFLGADGRPFNTFFDLASLDLSTSHDGRSPDAQCIAACYAKSFDGLNKFPGFLNRSDWKKAAVGFSFDGASVMLGTQNGAAAKLKALCEAKAVVIHGVAHVEQLVAGDAFKEVDYFDDWQDVVQLAYTYYHRSGKKRSGLEEVAKVIDEHLLKIAGVHGIRWVASQAQTIRALLTDLPSIAADLEVTAKSELGISYTLLTPSNSFLGKTFLQEFEGFRNKFKATVQSFVASDDGIAANDKFWLIYSDRTRLSMSKAELVDRLTSDADHDRLEGDPRWQLRSKLINWRFVAFSSFMLDVHNDLAILSKSFQSNSLLVFDIAKNVNKTLKSLEKLQDAAGVQEKLFWAEVKKDEDADVLRTCQLSDGEAGRVQFKSDRKQVTGALTDHLIKRYKKVLDDPVLKNMTAFDHRFWPPDSSDLEGINDEQIGVLYEAFKVFFKDEETKDTAVEQWNDMQSAIIKAPALRSRKYYDLWSHMLIHFHEEYPLPLRLVAISLIVPCDTSECERIFSLMNDIKTSERSRMATETLKNLMGMCWQFKPAAHSSSPQHGYTNTHHLNLLVCWCVGSVASHGAHCRGGWKAWQAHSMPRRSSNGDC